MASLTVRPLGRPVTGRVALRGSPLAGGVAMTAAALADGVSKLDGLRIDATGRAIVEGLQALEVDATLDERAGRFQIHGRAGHVIRQEADLDCQGSPVAAQLLVALCTLGYGEYRIHGGDPTAGLAIGSVVDALRDLGAQIGYESGEGELPVTVRARGLRGGRTHLREPTADALAAVLVVAPYAAQDVFVELAPRRAPLRASIILDVMLRFGVAVLDRDLDRFIVAAPQRYRGSDLVVPPDACQAAVAWMLGLVTGGTVEIDVVPDVASTAIKRACACLERMGATIRRGSTGTAATVGDGGLCGATLDLRGYGELLCAMALTALFASGPSRITGVVDGARSRALMGEMAKLGAVIELTDDALSIAPPETIAWSDVDAHGDPDLSPALAAAAMAADRPISVTDLADDESRWAELTGQLASLDS